MNTVLLVAGVFVLASPVFPKWERVDVQNIMKPVPLLDYAMTGYGAVSKVAKLEALPEGCQILEAGKVVGYRLTCK